MKRMIALSAMACLALGFISLSRSSAQEVIMPIGHKDCGAPCGNPCPAPCPAPCREPKVKKTAVATTGKKTIEHRCYSSKCEDFALPCCRFKCNMPHHEKCKDCGGCGHCEKCAEVKCDTGCDNCHNCGHVHTKKVLYVKIRKETECTNECKVVCECAEECSKCGRAHRGLFHRKSSCDSCATKGCDNVIVVEPAKVGEKLPKPPTPVDPIKK